MYKLIFRLKDNNNNYKIESEVVLIKYDFIL